MLLTPFLRDLLTTGEVTLSGQPAPFTAADLQVTEELLEAYYREDRLELPHEAPLFEAPAACWAASYLFHALQLALVRELDETVIQEYLRDFEGEQTPAAMYSVDLTFRYLPDLLHLAKGLAPGDALVAQLKATARRWPLSFVGQELPVTEAEAVVLAHPSLRQQYIDRIIQAQDRLRAGQEHLRPLIQTALGGHAATLWPDFHAFTLLSF